MISNMHRERCQFIPHTKQDSTVKTFGDEVDDTIKNNNADLLPQIGALCTGRAGSLQSHSGFISLTLETSTWPINSEAEQ